MHTPLHAQIVAARELEIARRARTERRIRTSLIPRRLRAGEQS